jgi:hypothetical protein
MADVVVGAVTVGTVVVVGSELVVGVVVGIVVAGLVVGIVVVVWPAVVVGGCCRVVACVRAVDPALVVPL